MDIYPGLNVTIVRLLKHLSFLSSADASLSVLNQAVSPNNDWIVTLCFCQKAFSRTNIMLVVGTSFLKLLSHFLTACWNSMAMVTNTSMFETNFYFLLPSVHTKSAITCHFQSFLSIPFPGLILDSFITFMIHIQSLKTFAVLFHLFTFHRTAFASTLIICHLSWKALCCMSHLCHLPSSLFFTVSRVGFITHRCFYRIICLLKLF